MHILAIKDDFSTTFVARGSSVWPPGRTLERPDSPPNGPDGGASTRRLRPFSLTKPKIMTHLRLQVWGIRGLAIYQTANITVNFYDIFCNAYISACIRAKICGKYFGNFSAAQILLKIFTEIFAVHNFFCKKMRKKIRKF